MPTTITKSIGTSGRDYSTIQAWEDACPADLTAVDEIWRGECYNDSEFLSGGGALLLLDGITTDATRYIELTAASGQSFQDNGSVRSNALTYDQSKGAGLRNTFNYTPNIEVRVSNFHLSRLQMKTSGNVAQPILNTSGFGHIFKDLILLGTAGPDLNGTSYNVSMFLTSANTSLGGLILGGDATGCAVVRTSDRSAAGTGITRIAGFYSAIILTSTTVFGFTTPCQAAVFDTTNSSHNATEQASGLPGVSNQHSVSYSATTPFTQAGVTGNDLRAIAATPLAGNGLLDATNAPNDISGFARPAGPTIGAWQLASTNKTFLLH